MPKTPQVQEIPGVSFVVGRRFVSLGKQWESGDIFPNEEAEKIKHLDAVIGARFLVPVVEDDASHTIPRHLYPLLKTRSHALAKLKAEDKREKKPAKKAAAKKAEK